MDDSEPSPPPISTRGTGISRRPAASARAIATHFAMLTQLLKATYNPYKPAVLDWPKLEPETLARITSLPIWDIAVQTEIKASMRIEAFAATITRPGAAQAPCCTWPARNPATATCSPAWSPPTTSRCSRKPTYAPPKDAEWGFMVTGYSECMDSFFAYGLFEMARRSGFFPAELVETFEPVVQEEGRHILFFTNWIAWHKANMPLWRRPYFALKTAAVWAFLIWERIGIARDVDGLEGGDANFTDERLESPGRRDGPRDPDRYLPGRRQAAHGRLRPAPAAPHHHAQARPPRPALHPTQEAARHPLETTPETAAGRSSRSPASPSSPAW